MPRRIQRQRTRGWRMPAGAIYVGRPTIWGNPYVIGHPALGTGELVRDHAHAVDLYRAAWEDLLTTWHNPANPLQERFCGREVAVALLSTLRGRDLACWCPLDLPCHADVLLDLAQMNH